MTLFLALLAILCSLILIVGTHELGHALAARCFSVKIERISIGFGKPLYAWKQKNGIEWVWAKWPLGGYVKLLNHRIKPVSIQEYPYCFDKKPAFYRIIILLSGAVANLITAWLAFVLVFMLGYQQIPAIIHHVTPKSIAAHAGLKSGDQILSVAHTPTSDWREVVMVIATHLGQISIPVHVIDNLGRIHETQLNLSHWHYQSQKNTFLKSLGITLDSKQLKQKQISGVSFLKANQLAWHQITDLIHFSFLMLRQLVTGKLPVALFLGPFGLFASMASSFIQGLSVFCHFIGTFSIAVAIVNLLPVPGLDGGSIVYVLLEKIRGKPISVAFEVLLYQLALIAFFIVLVQLFVNDLERFL